MPTRITETSKTLIDNIFSSLTEYECISGNLLHSISDHLPQFLLMLSTDKLSVDENIPASYQNWSNFDKESFLREYSLTNWNELLKLDESNVDSSFDSFNSIMSRLVDRHLHTVKLTSRQLKLRFQKPWITTGILKSITKRDFFFRKL